MNRLNRILILTTPFSPNIGGVETHLDDLISVGIEKKMKFTVLTYQPLITKARGKYIEKNKNLTVLRLPWFRANLFLKLEKFPILEFIYLFPGIFLLSYIYLFLNQRKITVIHAQGLVAGVVGLIMSRMFSKKLIISTHSIYNFSNKGIYTRFIKYLFSQADNILTLSNQSKNEVLSLGVEIDKVHTFRYWVNQNIFKKTKKDQSRKFLKLSKNKNIVLFVGRLVEVKGVKELIRASSYIKKSTQLLIIGDGPLSEFVEKSAKKNSQITFIGKVPNNELPKYYSAADLLVIPSTHEEGFGRVTIEALSCGLPVIGSNRGGIKESINDKVGQLIDVTPKNIANTINSLLADKKKLAYMSKYATIFSKRYYNQKNADMIFKFYEEK